MDYKFLIEQLKHIVEYGDEEPAEYVTNRCGGCDLCDQAAEAIEILLAELADERYRHDRYVDFELAQAKELEAAKAAQKH